MDKMKVWENKTEPKHEINKHVHMADAPVIPVYTMTNFDRWGICVDERGNLPQITAEEIIPHIPESDHEYCMVALDRSAVYNMFKKTDDSWELIGVFPIYVEGCTCNNHNRFVVEDLYGNVCGSAGISGYNPTAEEIPND